MHKLATIAITTSHGQLLPPLLCGCSISWDPSDPTLQCAKQNQSNLQAIKPLSVKKLPLDIIFYCNSEVARSFANNNNYITLISQPIVQRNVLKQFVHEFRKDSDQLATDRRLHLLQQLLGVRVDEQIQGSLCKWGQINDQFRWFPVSSTYGWWSFHWQCCLHPS